MITTLRTHASGIWRGDGQGARALPHEVRRRLWDVPVALDAGGEIIESRSANGKGDTCKLQCTCAKT